MRNVFINGSGRSGTTLMRLLLDAHQNLIVFPVETTCYFKLFMRASGGKLEARITELNKILLSHFGKNHFGGFFPQINGKDLDLRDIDPAIFDSEIRNLPNVICSPSSYLEYLQKIYLNALKPKALSLGKKIASVLQVNDPDIESYLKHFKDSKIIFMIRHPLSCFNSKKKFYSKRFDYGLKERYEPFDIFVDQIREAFENANKYSSQPRVLIIRLEDLQNNPLGIMKHVAEFIGVEFCESLLLPTVLGRRHGGNMLERVDGYKIHNNLTSSYNYSLMSRYEHFIIPEYISSDKFYGNKASTTKQKKGIRFGFDFLMFFPEEKRFFSKVFTGIFRKGQRCFLVHFFGYLVMGVLSSVYYYFAHRFRLYKIILGIKKRGF